jgi:hypothetical protein
LVGDGRIVSTREVLREIDDGSSESLRQWAAQNPGLFATPTAPEGAFVTKIYGVSHFQQNIEQQKILKGGKKRRSFRDCQSGDRRSDSRHYGDV